MLDLVAEGAGEQLAAAHLKFLAVSVRGAHRDVHGALDLDAQLFDFDISNDLSLNVSPQIYYDMQHQRTAEIKLAIQF